MKLILFGPPGVGKSTVGRIIESQCGLKFFDGDDEMTPEERNLVSRKLWNDENRRTLLIRTAARIESINATSPNGVATALALTRQWMRDFLVERCGPLEFVLVKTSLSERKMEELVSQRHREGHPITVEAFRFFTEQFEKPTMPHETLINPFQNEGLLNNNIKKLFERIKI